jgi:transcriptional regulator with XRE-family HTH domain
MGRTRTREKGEHHELGDRIRKAVENAGFGDLSQEKMGAKIGVNASAYGKLINGHIAGSYETLRNICLVTNVSFEWLTTGRGPMVYSMTGGMIDISDVPAEKREAFKAVVQEMIKTTK